MEYFFVALIYKWTQDATISNAHGAWYDLAHRSYWDSMQMKSGLEIM